MQQIANISVFENLQANQHTLMGMSSMSVFNSTPTVENVTIKWEGGQVADFNQPDMSNPIIKGAFEFGKTEPKSKNDTPSELQDLRSCDIIKKLEEIEQRIPVIIEQETNPKYAASLIDSASKMFAQGKDIIEKRHTNYRVIIESDYPPINERLRQTAQNPHK